MASGKIQPGQKIFIKKIRNVRGNFNHEPQSVVVDKVGRKYFTIIDHIDKFEIETMNEYAGPNCFRGEYRAYLSMQEIADEKELEILTVKIKTYRGGYTLDQARQIVKILSFE